MKGFIGTAHKLVYTWDVDPGNYSQLKEGLTALKTALNKFKDLEERFSFPSSRQTCGDIVVFERVIP